MQQDPSAALQSYLTQHERLVWSGRPERFFVFNGTDIGVTAFGIFWLGFSLFWVFMASQASFWFASFGTPFVLVGLYLVFGRHLHMAYQRKNIIYGITNQRVLLLTTGSAYKLRSIELTDLGEIELKVRNNGLGDVIFNRPAPNRTGKNANSLPTGIENIEQIPDSLNVYQTLLDLKRKATAAAPPKPAEKSSFLEEYQAEKERRGGYRNI